MPVNARSCKHLQSLLGEEYEAARLKFKNPDGPPLKVKGAAKKKPPKAKPVSKGKRKKDDEEDEDEKPAKRTRKAATDRKGKAKEEDDDAAEDDDDDDTPSNGKAVVEVLLANKWDLEKGPDPTGWWISEKLDGVRFDCFLSLKTFSGLFSP